MPDQPTLQLVRNMRHRLGVLMTAHDVATSTTSPYDIAQLRRALAAYYIQFKILERLHGEPRP